MAANNEGTIFADISRCLACRSCELACAVEHSASKNLGGALAEPQRPQSRISVVAVEGAAIPLQCRHCEDAPCAAVCPTGAITKLGPNQPVVINQDRCIGCKFCVMVCPFGVVTMRRDGKVALKCDMCLSRLEGGKQPACVSACPTRALGCRDLSEITAGKRRATAKAVIEARHESEQVAEEALSK
ncbi:MAG: 4Fe-4S dicluster domain-containing protein [Gemmatimonadales bacterium]|nr:MAG: 4Fe-4S dicluster domain-containing protein [Gemmatimonadales bacterium]